MSKYHYVEGLWAIDDTNKPRLTGFVGTRAMARRIIKRMKERGLAKNRARIVQLRLTTEVVERKR